MKLYQAKKTHLVWRIILTMISRSRCAGLRLNNGLRLGGGSGLVLTPVSEASNGAEPIDSGLAGASAGFTSTIGFAS
jgi:hypothetical protein